MTRSRSQSPSMAKLHFKLERIISRQDQLKLSFSQLKSRIKFGLLEAEDVFASLAIPLLKLVGLKTAEMAEEGRSSTVFTNISFRAWGESRDMSRWEAHRPSSTVERKYETQLEEDYTISATIAGKELIQKQKMQLNQLVQLLKQVERSVNSSQKSMFQTIDDHKDSIDKFMQRAISHYVSIVQQLGIDNRALVFTRQLLKALYGNVCAVLDSVEDGVNTLMKELTEQMCVPMIEYVKGFKAEMTTGTCPRLLVALEDMREAAKDGKVEIERARKKAREAEERKLEALNMLKESEERIKKIRQQLGFFADDQKESTAHYPKNKLLAAPPEDHTKDDKLLWELLKKKRTCRRPASPFGPSNLFPVATDTKPHAKPTPERPCRPTTRGYTRSRSSKAQPPDSWLPLGPSPSATAKQALPHKHAAW